MTLLVILLFLVLVGAVMAAAVSDTEAQVWQERAERYQTQAAALSERLSESEAAYQALQHSLETGGWVRVPTERELEHVKNGGSWN